MGGTGSGYRGHRPTVESATRLNVRACKRLNLFRAGGVGSLTFHPGDEAEWTAEIEVSEHSLLLRYRVWDDDGENEILWERRLPYVFVPCRFGGQRPYWICPYCRRCRDALLLTTNGRTWACRKCLRTCYLSQTLNRADRMQRRADKTYDSLGGYDEDGTVYKPKWMRWRTFNRKMNLANRLGGAADELFAVRAFRILGRYMTPEKGANS